MCEDAYARWVVNGEFDEVNLGGLVEVWEKPFTLHGLVFLAYSREKLDVCLE